MASPWGTAWGTSWGNAWGVASSPAVGDVWGGSWGTSWGSSWGSAEAPTPPVQATGHGAWDAPLSQDKLRQMELESEAEMIEILAMLCGAGVIAWA